MFGSRLKRGERDSNIEHALQLSYSAFSRPKALSCEEDP
jgi:hypothetical protein